MKTFMKTNYRMILCALTGMICGFAFCYALLYSKINMPSDEEVAAVDHIGRINILPETSIICAYSFSGCEHTIERSIDPLIHVGQTKEEFLNEYRDVEIEQFSSDYVKMHCLRIGPCPQHLMLRADDSGQLIIYQTTEESLDIVGIQSLPLYAAAFPSEIAEELYEGIIFPTLDQINEYLENAES